MQLPDIDRSAIIYAAIIMATAVVLGAYGSHGLKEAVSESRLNAFEIGVRYQMIHGLALLFCALLGSGRRIFWIRNMFLLGIVLFSGSLYALSTAELTGISTQFVGPLTPIGGIFFIIGWVLLALFAKKHVQ